MSTPYPPQGGQPPKPPMPPQQPGYASPPTGGGYGAPVPPPAPAGPSMPPFGQPVFGQPGPGGPPPYGTPAQGGLPPMPPVQPEAGKKKGKGCLITMLVIFVVFALGAGSAAWFFLGLGKQDALWALPHTNKKGDTENYLSTWFTDKAVVRAQQDGVSALDPASGKRIWGTPVPGDGTIICDASPVAGKNIVVLGYGKPGSCTTVFALDLTQGKVLWKLPVKKSDTLPSLAVSGDTVVVNDKVAYALKDGSKEWTAKALSRKSGCDSGTLVGGPKLVRSVACATKVDEYGSPEELRIDTSEIDPSSGHVKWTYTGQQQVAADIDIDSRLLSTAPIVTREGKDTYRILSDSGKPRGAVPDGVDDYFENDTAFLGGSPKPYVLAEDGTLVLKHSRHGDDYITAFDMDSGKQLWEKKSGEDSPQYDLVQGLDGKIGALKWDRPFFDPNHKRPFSLVTFDLKTGAEDEVQQFAGFGDSLDVFQAAYVHDGRLFVASVSNEGTLMSDSQVPSYMPAHESSLIAYDM
jgi:outer membrane protein assembly factor BamB